MNWKEIKKKYPKSCRILSKWSDRTDIDCVLAYDFWQPKNVRHLYDFFDKQKIYGATSSFFNPNKKNPVGWQWSIGCIEVFGNGFSKSRKSAEKALFTKCFEILEGRLK